MESQASTSESRVVNSWMYRVRETLGRIRTMGGLRVWLFYLPGPGPWVMSWLRRRWVLFRHPHCHIEFRGPVYLGPGFSLHMPTGGTFIVGYGVEFRRGFRAEFAGPDARIEIGDGCSFTYDVLMQVTTSMTIGNRVNIGQDGMLVDGSHKFRDLTKAFLEQGYDYRPLTIHDEAQILSKVTVVNDVGERSIVAANAVVTKPIPAFCVAGGVPARIIEYFGPRGQEPLGQFDKQR